MKKISKINTLMSLFLMALLCILFVACKKENNTGIEYRMSNDVFFMDCICGNLCMLPSNNFYTYGDIASVGTVSNLSMIKKIPESGWAKIIAVHPGYGYVLREGDETNGYKYARVFVEDWILSTDGGIIGAILWYEDNWR